MGQWRGRGLEKISRGEVGVLLLAGNHGYYIEKGLETVCVWALINFICTFNVVIPSVSFTMKL